MITLDSVLDVELCQHKTGYRFSADAVLLYSFVNLVRVKQIADLGAGSGVIGLLLAKRYPTAHVTLIELQKGLVKLAERNVALNELGDRVSVIHEDIRKLGRKETGRASLVAGHGFDLAVSNPPFRKPKSGLVSPADEKAVARHELHLPLSDLARSASGLLRHHGRFCLIHLPERLTDVFEVLRANALEPKRIRFVHSNGGTAAKMVLIEAVKGSKPGLEVERPLFMYSEAGVYSEEVRAIYGK